MRICSSGDKRMLENNFGPVNQTRNTLTYWRIRIYYQWFCSSTRLLQQGLINTRIIIWASTVLMKVSVTENDYSLVSLCPLPPLS